MAIHVLERSQRIERPLDEVFPYYADAGNLERITRPGSASKSPRGGGEMRAGAPVSYRPEFLGVAGRGAASRPWDPPHRFVDAQLSGPYSLWHHTHTFRADGEDATILGDRVRYAIPFGPFGEAARSLFVECDLERIFDHRRDAVAEAFGAPTDQHP